MQKIIFYCFYLESQHLNPNFEINSDKSCKYCHGRGFDIILFKTELIKCKLSIIYKNGKAIYEGCNGTGYKITNCWTCNGTGKFGENPCPTCINPKTGIGYGTFVNWPSSDPKRPGIKCFKCGGTGKIKKLIQRETEIKDAPKCKKCNGTGVNTNIGSPVIPSETAKILMSILSK